MWEVTLHVSLPGCRMYSRMPTNAAAKGVLYNACMRRAGIDVQNIINCGFSMNKDGGLILLPLAGV